MRVIEEFLSGEVQRLSFGDGTKNNMKLSTPTAVSQFSHNLVAKDLNGISWQEREQVLNEIHGVIDQIDETPKFISDCLFEMEESIERMLPRFKSLYMNLYRARPSNNNSTTVPALPPSSHPYERAILQDSAYVQSEHFRRAFLRAERFNPEKAAERFLLHFEEKEYLFGTEFLSRDVRLKDVDADALSRIESGFLQLFPARDVGGRTVLISIGQLQRTDNKTDLEILHEV
jgi:hypothetical protein